MTTLARPAVPSNITRNVSGSDSASFIALGLALIGLGTLAFYNLPVASTASVFRVGIVMLIGAGAQLGAAFCTRSRGRFGLLLASAVLYGGAGAVTIADPTLAGERLALMLAFGLTFSGMMRLWWSLALRPLSGWAWISASGLFSIAAGFVFTDWQPANNVWLLGMIFAVDLTFQGAMAVGSGIAVKRIAE
jgi:uncharacterized membrane protein HdeD (DUF308 family)